MTGRADPTDVEVIDVDTLLDSHCVVQRYRLRHRQFAGGLGPEIGREVLDRGGVSLVLPIDLTRREVLLVEQFRIGPFVAGEPAWLLECVAGINEPGEAPEEVARREAVEEAGITLGPVVRVASVFASPGASTEHAHLFAAPADLSQAGGVHGLEAEGEDIKVHVVSFDTVRELIGGGRVVNAKTLIMLQWLLLNEGSLEHILGVRT